MRKTVLYLFGLVLVLMVAVWGVLDLASANASSTEHILISEVYYDTVGSDSDEEWVEIYNPTVNSVDIGEYKIGDEETMGEGEGMYQFPLNVFIGAHETLVIAKSATGYYNLYGKYPDFEITTSDDDQSDFSQTSDMVKYSTWATGSLSLTNNGDEVLLLDDSDNVIDVVVYEAGIYSNVISHPGVDSGYSLHRRPIGSDTDDCSLDFVDQVAPNPGYDWTYESDKHFNGVGKSANDEGATENIFWKASLLDDNAGFMFYGPYTNDQAEGMYQVSFRLRVDNNTSADNVVKIDARNQDGSGLWVTKDIKGTDFDSPDKWQNFNIWFRRIEEGSMEYRVWFYDNQDVDFDNVMLSKVDRLIYEAEDLNHNTGQLVLDETYSKGAAWQAGTGDNINHMVFGPYHDLSEGNYEVIYVAKIDDNSLTENVVRFDINNIYGTDEYKFRAINGSDFKEDNAWQSYKLYFARNDSGVIEYRAFSEGNAALTVDNIIVINRDKIRYEAENLFIFDAQIIDELTASENQAVRAKTNDNDPGWMIYGPYTSDQLDGDYQACFNIMADDNTSAMPVVRINAYNSEGGGIEVDRDILGTDFTNVNKWQEFCLPFSRTDDGKMEYRVWFYDLADVTVDYVQVGVI